MMPSVYCRKDNNSTKLLSISDASFACTDTAHANTVHANTVHANTVHANTVHANEASDIDNSLVL